VRPIDAQFIPDGGGSREARCEVTGVAELVTPLLHSQSFAARRASLDSLSP